MFFFLFFLFLSIIILQIHIKLNKKYAQKSLNLVCIFKFMTVVNIFTLGIVQTRSISTLRIFFFPFKTAARSQQSFHIFYF